jgi:WD40 repeat protein
MRGHEDGVWSVAFSPDGTRIVSGSSDKTLWLWDATSGQSIGAPLRGHEDWVLSVAFSPGGHAPIRFHLARVVSLVYKDLKTTGLSLRLGNAPGAHITNRDAEIDCPFTFDWKT